MITQPSVVTSYSPTKTVKPFAEIFRGTTNGTTNVPLWDIPAGTIIELVLCKTIVAGVGTGNLMVGDTDNTDGFIAASDATAAADTILGDDPTERGDYLYDSTKKGSFVKHYESAGKQLILDGSAATLTTEATVEVIVKGLRYSG